MNEKMKTKENVKINVSIKEELVKRLDAYAERNYLSRSGLVSLALTNYLNSVELVSCVTDMAVSMRKIADNNYIDDETLEKLKDFERVCQAVGVGK